MAKGLHSMRWKSDTTVEKTVLVSRRIIWSFFGLFFLAGIISAFVEAYGPKWLEILVAIPGGISMLLLVISCGMPGIFILLGVPWLARAWFRGINPIWYSSAPWDDVSGGEVRSTYLQSIISFVVLIIVIVAVVRFNFQR